MEQKGRTANSTQERICAKRGTDEGELIVLLLSFLSLLYLRCLSVDSCQDAARTARMSILPPPDLVKLLILAEDLQARMCWRMEAKGGDSYTHRPEQSSRAFVCELDRSFVIWCCCSQYMSVFNPRFQSGPCLFPSFSPLFCPISMMLVCSVAGLLADCRDLLIQDFVNYAHDPGIMVSGLVWPTHATPEYRRERSWLEGQRNYAASVLRDPCCCDECLVNCVDICLFCFWRSAHCFRFQLRIHHFAARQRHIDPSSRIGAATPLVSTDLKKAPSFFSCTLPFLLLFWVSTVAYLCRFCWLCACSPSCDCAFLIPILYLCRCDCTRFLIAQQLSAHCVGAWRSISSIPAASSWWTHLFTASDFIANGSRCFRFSHCLSKEEQRQRQRCQHYLSFLIICCCCCCCSCRFPFFFIKDLERDWSSFCATSSAWPRRYDSERNTTKRKHYCCGRNR